jgi:hypothetical protein
VPLALQALLPFVALLAAAGIVMRRPRRPENGWIAFGATSIACLITLVELLRLSRGERVDVPYLTTFPYADIALRLDALSLAFSVVTLATAALLMLVRVRIPGDRRDPWASWLLTSAAVLALMMAASLLLAYIVLQLLTLAWSGTLDEAAPRGRRLRLTIAVSDIGLLLVAASAIQSVGTSSFSGVPSDTFGPAAFLLALVPVLVRILALAWPASGSQAPVAFEPAVAFAAPAGYLLLRLIAIMGGRLPGRPLEMVVFGGSLLLGAAAGISIFFQRAERRMPALLLAAQAALALALVAGSLPVLALASTWLWLQLILLTGLFSLRLEAREGAGTIALVTLAALPGGMGFIGVFIGFVALRSGEQAGALLAFLLVVLLLAAAGLSRWRQLDRWPRRIVSGWAISLLLIAALPAIWLSGLVLPAAQTVRTLAPGTVLLSPLGITVSGVTWPALLATAVLVGALLALWRSRVVVSEWPFQPALPALPAFPRLALPRLPRRWTTRAIWAAFLAAAGIAVLRP